MAGRSGGSDPPKEERGPGGGRDPEANDEREHRRHSHPHRHAQGAPGDTRAERRRRAKNERRREKATLGAKLGWRLYAAIETDRRWFEENPSRSHRIRPVLPLERPGVPADPSYIYCVLRQVVPGVRLGVVFTCFGEPPPDTEPVGHALYDLCEHYARGAAPGAAPGAPIPMALLAERVMQMARAGRA